MPARADYEITIPVTYLQKGYGKDTDGGNEGLGGDAKAP
jgi:hypothetical protein